jgi:hypothetical protein
MDVRQEAFPGIDSQGEIAPGFSLFSDAEERFGGIVFRQRGAVNPFGATDRACAHARSRREALAAALNGSISVHGRMFRVNG